MRLQILSDIHLEFGNGFHVYNHGADTLVLAGDIVLAKSFKKKERNIHNVDYYMFFDQVCERFKNVIYIMGNQDRKSTRLNSSH